VYSFGNNEKGNLGIGSCETLNEFGRSIFNLNNYKFVPQKINFENDEKIDKIFTNCNCVGAFFYSSYFYLFLEFKKIIFCYLAKKNLFSCGLNNFNQTGIAGSLTPIVPTIVNFLKNIKIENIYTGYKNAFIKTNGF
jgi:alpha-tubulin suppressor-like RCC1 family protein